MNFYLQLILLIVSVVLGGALVHIFSNKAHLKLLLSFSGGFLLTIIFIHLLPEMYSEGGISMGYFVLLGFLLQLVLEYFSQGIEHGHTHLHGFKESVFPYTLFLSLSLHALIETIPLGTEHDHHHGLYWGVFLHKIPVAVALISIFKAAGYSAGKSWMFLMLFSLIAPTGLLFGAFLPESMVEYSGYLLGVVLGMLIHISTTIIFESSESHKINFLKLTAIVIGFAVAALTSV